MAISSSDIQNKLAGISTGKKIIAVAGIAAAIAVITVIVMWANRPVFQVLFSNLSPEDAGAITEKLKELKVPYEVGDSGSVMVPEDKVHEIRMTLASQGLPSGGGVGFEIFDKTTIGMTDFIQKINYRRALQGELSRTIGQLSEVEQARVHLAVPEKTLFSDKKEHTSASVVLKLRGGKVLTQSQVQGIVHLVSSSVEGLSPQNITIVDTNGNVLSRPSDDSYNSQLSNYQNEYQRGLEKSLEDRVQSMLERAVGPGKAVVRISGTLDFKQVETTEEKYDPDKVAVRSEQRSQDNSSGSSSSGTASGVPGVLSNLPSAKGENPKAAGGGGKGGNTSQSNRTQETINYEINKTVNHIVEPVGNLKRLSAAVLIDGNYEAVKGTDGKESRKYIPRTEEELKKYTEIVKKAVGYSEERGDQVEVLSIPFESNVSINETEPEQGNFGKFLGAPAILPVIKYLVAGITVLMIFLFVVKPMLKTVMSPGGHAGNISGVIGAGGTFPRVSELETAPASSYQRAHVDDANFREEAIKIAKDNPTQTAKLIKSWISEK
ncbi:MAG: flagellar basal-body MS-ring/collar protein FliF [Nitrospira sp.]|nr:flagellar basal-body MS-ring/collar protein FliF [Nitrospira sp.]